MNASPEWVHNAAVNVWAWSFFSALIVTLVYFTLDNTSGKTRRRTRTLRKRLRAPSRFLHLLWLLSLVLAFGTRQPQVGLGQQKSSLLVDLLASVTLTDIIVALIGAFATIVASLIKSNSD